MTHSRVPCPRASLALAVVLILIGAAPPLAAAAVPGGSPTFSHPLDITNAYMPFQPGGVKVFNGGNEGRRTVVVDLYLTTTRTFRVNKKSVRCRILQETEFEGGQVSEISQNFFAQADDGTVYYFGELVDKYEGGVIVSHEGSWLVGGPGPGDPKETATASAPAIFMPGQPEVGDVFKPEDLFPVVDETVTVKAVGLSLTVTAGRFSNVIQVEETSRLPGAPEAKWYAAGVGVVKVRARGEFLSLVATTFLPE